MAILMVLGYLLGMRAVILHVSFRSLVAILPSVVMSSYKRNTRFMRRNIIPWDGTQEEEEARYVVKTPPVTLAFAPNAVLVTPCSHIEVCQGK